MARATGAGPGEQRRLVEISTIQPGELGLQPAGSGKFRLWVLIVVAEIYKNAIPQDLQSMPIRYSLPEWNDWRNRCFVRHWTPIMFGMNR